jgi:hypothetical protein
MYKILCTSREYREIRWGEVIGAAPSPSPRILRPFISRPYPCSCMYPAQSFDTELWCFAEDPGNEYIRLPPFPCKREACPRYRAEFPHCVKMSRRYCHARDYP